MYEANLPIFHITWHTMDSIDALKNEYEGLMRGNNLDAWPVAGGIYSQVDKCLANLKAKIVEWWGVPQDVCELLHNLYTWKMEDLYKKMNTNPADHARTRVLLELAKDIKFQSQLEKERQLRLDAEKRLHDLKQKMADNPTSDVCCSQEDAPKVEALKAEISRLQDELKQLKTEQKTPSIRVEERSADFCNEAIKRARSELDHLKEDYRNLHHNPNNIPVPEPDMTQSEADDLKRELQSMKKAMETLDGHAKSFILGTLEIIREKTNDTRITDEEVARCMTKGEPDQYFNMLRQALS